MEGSEILRRLFFGHSKGHLMGCAAQMLQGRLKAAVFGDTAPTNVEVNLGVLAERQSSDSSLWPFLSSSETEDR